MMPSSSSHFSVRLTPARNKPSPVKPFGDVGSVEVTTTAPASGNHPSRLAKHVCLRTRDSISNAAIAATALLVVLQQRRSPITRDAASSRVAFHVAAYVRQM